MSSVTSVVSPGGMTFRNGSSHTGKAFERTRDLLREIREHHEEDYEALEQACRSGVAVERGTGTYKYLRNKHLIDRSGDPKAIVVDTISELLNDPKIKVVEKSSGYSGFGYSGSRGGYRSYV